MAHLPRRTCGHYNRERRARQARRSSSQAIAKSVLLPGIADRRLGGSLYTQLAEPVRYCWFIMIMQQSPDVGIESDVFWLLGFHEAS